MTERQTLLLVLVLVYLAECLAWVRRGGVVFRRVFRAWSPVAGGGVVANDAGDLHWLWPLPPFGETYVALGPAVSVASGGVLNFTAHGFHPAGRPLVAPRFFPWEQVREISRHGRTLRVNGADFWKCDSIHEAIRIGRLLDAVRTAKPEAREGLLADFLDAAFDGAALRLRLEEVRRAVGPVRIAAAALFATVFLAGPLAIARFGWFPPLLYLLPVVAALMATTAWLAYRAHRSTCPGADEERLRFAIVVALSPVSGIRAPDLVRRAALEAFHPVGVAAALLDRTGLDAFAGAAWRDLRHPRLPECPVSEPAAAATERWFRDAMCVRIERLCRRAGLDPAAWERPPGKTDPSHARYCPRCRSQFTAAAGVCRDCGGRALTDFPVA